MYIALLGSSNIYLDVRNPLWPLIVENFVFHHHTYR